MITGCRLKASQNFGGSIRHANICFIWINIEYKSTARIQPLFDQLAAQLMDDDGESSDTVEQLQTLTQGTMLSAPLQQIAATIADYDFDVALELKVIEQEGMVESCITT